MDKIFFTRGETMMTLGQSLKSLRKKKGLSQYEVADKLGIKRGRYNSWENDIAKPRFDMLDKICEFFNIPMNELIGHSEDKLYVSSNLSPLSEKDEKDIAKRMEKIKNDLTSEDGLSFNGEPMSPEAIESLLEAMEYAVRQTQRINKKYVPHKYRKENE